MQYRRAGAQRRALCGEVARATCGVNNAPHTVIPIASSKPVTCGGLSGMTAIILQLPTNCQMTERLSLLAEVYSWFTKGFDTKDL